MNLSGESIKPYQFLLKSQYQMNSNQNKTGKNGVKITFCAGRALPIYDEYNNYSHHYIFTVNGSCESIYNLVVGLLMPHLSSTPKLCVFVIDAN